ncbi:MAG: hypothetical protein Q9180_006452, partial [Flavoplaca navasiana]
WDVLSETLATDVQDWNVKFDDNASQSGFSQTTYASTLMSGGHITIPAPPRSSRGGAPFECPYCYFIVVTSSTRSWHGHVFQDLQPYTCLEQTCSTPQKLYTTKHEWVHHNNTMHRCEDYLVAGSHQQEKNWSCVLCEEPQSTRQQYDRHVARHLQELALFVLPRNDEESDDDESDDNEPPRKTESEGSFQNEMRICCRCHNEFLGSRPRCRMCLYTACSGCLRPHGDTVELGSPVSIEASDDDEPSPTKQEGREDLGKTGDDKEGTALELTQKIEAARERVEEERARRREAERTYMEEQRARRLEAAPTVEYQYLEDARKRIRRDARSFHNLGEEATRGYVEKD